MSEDSGKTRFTYVDWRDHVARIRGELLELLSVKRISVTNLAKESGITRMVVWNFVNKKTSGSYATLCAFQDFLDSLS